MQQVHPVPFKLEVIGLSICFFPMLSSSMFNRSCREVVLLTTTTDKHHHKVTRSIAIQHISYEPGDQNWKLRFWRDPWIQCIVLARLIRHVSILVLLSWVDYNWPNLEISTLWSLPYDWTLESCKVYHYWHHWFFGVEWFALHGHPYKTLVLWCLGLI